MDTSSATPEIKRDSRIKKEVSNKVFQPVVNAIKQIGLQFNDFLIGVPYDEAYLLNKRERVEWWVYCRILKNMRSNFSELDFEKIGADFLRTGPFIDGLIGFFLFTSKTLPKTLADKILKRITSHILCLKMQIEFPGTNRIRFILKLDEGYEHVSEFAYGNKGIIKELGVRTGLKGCKVDLQFIDQGGIYEMTWEKGSVLFRIKRRILWLFSINKAFWELTDTNEELLKEYEKLEDYKNNLEKKVDERTLDLKKAHDELAETIDLLQKAKQAQNHFFTNISHEFRTPLTLILGPVKEITEKINDDKTKNELRVVYRNTNKLLRLVNQLLDISKIESGNMKLQAVPQNIVTLLSSLVQSFCSYAERKKIALKFKCEEEEIIAYLDKDKIEKIITNLLSNAFKFTPEGGQIEIKVKQCCHFGLDRESQTYNTMKTQNLNQNQNVKPLTLRDLKVGGFVEISIKDTGIGISKERITKIFDRFYQVEGSATRSYEGTGIGLSLTKELVELHKGKIDVESEEGKGTTFKVSIPLGKEHLKPEEICETLVEIDSKEIPRNEIPEEGIQNKESNATLYAGLEKPVLLIIEDNMDVKNYIKNNLDKDYRIIEAVDGEDGWDKSITKIPDLIISDVMMPKLDGFRLCRKLKTDQRTSHIPLILLTAKATMDDKIEGLEIGADDYIMKPFDTCELKARIINLIRQRKRIHEYFKKHGLFEIEEKNITSLDQQFMEKVVRVINEHLSDSSFGVEPLANLILVSRSLLLKKMEALIGEPPVELIKRMRLEKAAKMIKNNSGNISEIAIEVGYNNPSYFAECFRKHFGISPSEYRRNL